MCAHSRRQLCPVGRISTLSAASYRTAPLSSERESGDVLRVTCGLAICIGDGLKSTAGEAGAADRHERVEKPSVGGAVERHGVLVGD